MKRLAPGSRLGSYTVQGLLGEGGAGAVYRARDERLGREVAVKVLTSRLAGEEAHERFRREARAAAAVVHANVLAVHDASLEGDTPYLVLELAPRGSLASRIAAQGRLDWREVVRIGAGLASGLAAAHDAGLVHRDVKPANVLFDAHDTPKLADFGLVRDELAHSRRLTQTGELLGTPGYLAPEQVDEAKRAGPSSDLYGLGATLYSALAGRPPFEGAGTSLVFRVLREVPEPVRRHAPDVPPALEALVAGLLEKDPGKRPPSAHAVAATLAAFGRAPGKPAAARPRALPLVPVVLALAALVAVGLGLAAGLAARGNASAGHEPGSGTSPAPVPSARASISPVASPAARPTLAPSPAKPAPEERAADAYRAAFAGSKRLRLRSAWGDPRWKLDQRVSAGTLAADGSFALAATGGDFTVRRGVLARLDARTGARAWVREIDEGWVTAVALSADGTLAAAGGSSWLALHDAATGELRVRTGLPAPGGFVSALAFSPDGRELAASLRGQGPPSVVLWRPGEPVRVLASLNVLSLVWAAPGELVTGGEDGKVLRWRTEHPGEPPVPESPRERAAGVVSLASDGDAVVSSTGELRSLEVTRRGVSLCGYFDGTAHEAVSVAVVSSGESGYCLVASGGRGLSVYRPGRRDLFGALDSEHLAWTAEDVRDLRVFPGGRRVLGAQPAGQALGLWEIPGGADPRGTSLHSGTVTSLALSDDGAELLSGGRDGRVLRWSVVTGQGQRLEGDERSQANGVAWVRARPLVARETRFESLVPKKVLADNVVARSLAGSSRLGVAVGGGQDGVVRFLDGNAEVAHAELPRIEGLAAPPWITCAAWAGDVAYVFGGRSVYALTPTSSSGPRELIRRGPEAPDVSALAVSPDGSRVVLGDSPIDPPARAILYQRRADGAYVPRELAAFPNSVTAVAFVGPDLVLLASRDRTLRLLDVSGPDPREVERVELGGGLLDHATSLAVAEKGGVAYAGTGRGVVLALELPPP